MKQMIKDMLPDFLICTLFYITGLIVATVIWNCNFAKYDINRDGKINSKDLLELRLYLLED